MNAGAAHFDAQRVAKPFKREFTGIISRAPGRRHQPQNRRAVYDMPMALGAHHGNNLACQIVPAKQIGLENRAQRAARQVFGGARAGIGAVVKQRIQPPAGGGQHVAQRGADAGLVGVIQLHRVKAFGGQARHICLLAAGGKHPPAGAAQPVGGIIANARRAAGDQNGTLCHALGRGDSPPFCNAAQLWAGKYFSDAAFTAFTPASITKT